MTSTLKKWPIFGFLQPDFISDIHMVLIYGELGNFCLIVKNDGMVYALQNGCERCMKISSSNKQNMIFPKKIDTLYEQKIKTMAYGKGSYVLVLTTNGKMYSWGKWESNSPNGLDCCHNYEPHNIQINEFDEFVMDIACGSHHCMALTKTGNVYVWGDTTYERMWDLSASPMEVDCSEYSSVTIFCSISCGANHCVAVTPNGCVYSWGSNFECQLGIGNTDYEDIACHITYFTKIVIEKVVCGCNHTLALSNKGILYSWGSNSSGQLGVILDEKINSSLPVVIPSLPRVLDMAASNCANISVAMGIDHQIFMWGHCSGHKIALPTLISVDNIYDVFALYASPHAMHQPFVINDEERKKVGDHETMNITEHLMAAFDDKNTSDLIIEVQDKPIYVHKVILKIRSKYFNAMFQGDWKENNDSVLKICEFSYVAYRAFLKFLYTEKIDALISTKNVLELIQLADLYGDDEIKAGYVSVLSQRISTANAALFYSVALKYHDPVLKRCCIEFAVPHMKEISKSSSFSELTPETMRSLIIEVGDAGAFRS